MLIGVGCGALVMEALPAVFGKLLPVHTVMHFPWRAVVAGLGTGLLTTLLFCLPPLLDVRAVRPMLVLRRLVEQGPSHGDGVVRALVGAPAATWDRGCWLCCAGRDCVGACRIQ